MKNQKLGVAKTTVLGLQHMFAMFGATILVPILSGLSVQVTLFATGIGTLLFHLVSKSKVPAFLGSSFAFLVGIRLITDDNTGVFAGSALTQQERLAYATGGILIAGIVYLLFALLVKVVGVKRFMKFTPPIVTAPTVILIGIMLAPFAISQSSENLLLAVTTLVIVIVASSWGKGMIKIIPILLGIGGAYILAVILHNFTSFTNADGSAIIDFVAALNRVGRPSVAYQTMSDVSLAGYYVGTPPFMWPRFGLVPILIMIPFSFATIAEHIGDMVALSNILEEDLTEDPGLHRTLMGDGIASVFAGIFGGPANTTYGENVGVVVLTKVTNPRVVQLAAVFATLLAFSPLIAAVIYSIPTAIIGGASFMLYGMIAAVGIRNLVESRVDMGSTKNLTVIAVMLVTGLGLRFGPVIEFAIGNVNVPVDRLGIAIAVILGVFLNVIIPDKKEEANLPLSTTDIEDSKQNSENNQNNGF